MRHRLFYSIVVYTLIFLLVACGSSSTEGIDGEAVEVKFYTAEPAVAGEETTLVAEMSGIDFPELTVLQFDVRIDGKPEIKTGEMIEKDVYQAKFTFPEPGVYEVVLHIYIEDLHLMEREQVEVQ